MVRKEEADSLFFGMNDRAMPFLSREELEKIRAQTIAIAGFGGVGAIAAELLARWGVGTFRLLDKDSYELSNVNRQIFATPGNVGMMKAEIAAQRIREINPFSDVEMVICERLNKDSTTRLVRGADIVLMETDSPSSSILLHKYAKKYEVPLVNGHCYQIVKGKIHVFDYRKAGQRDFDEPSRFRVINTLAQRLLDMTRKGLDEMTESEIEALDGNMPPRYTALNYMTNLVGCMTVAETINLVLGKTKPCLHPKEILIDISKRKMKVSESFSLTYCVDFVLRHREQILRNMMRGITGRARRRGCRA